MRNQRPFLFSSRAMALFVSLGFGRNLGVAGCSLGKILIQRSVHLTDSPANSTAEKIQEKRIRPVFRAVAQRGIEHSSFAISSCPGYWIGSTLIALAFHSLCFKRENHMEIGRKILERVPLFGEADG